MAVKRKNGDYYKNMDFNFLEFERMQVFQPVEKWDPKFVYVDGKKKEKKLCATDLAMETHFQMKKPSSTVIGGLKRFLASFTPVIHSPSRSIQAQLLTVSADILECSEFLLKTHCK